MKTQRTIGTRADDCRLPFKCVTHVSWRNTSGESKLTRAEIVDLSIEGACILSQDRIEPQTMVYLQASGHGAIGNASVRYCVRANLKYRIGLLFSAPTKLADAARQKCLDQRAIQGMA